jgi:hypothetical protein
VVTANPGTSATHVQQILVQLAKQTAQTASKDQAIQEIRQISSQVATYPFGTVSQSLAQFAKQLTTSSRISSSNQATPGTPGFAGNYSSYREDRLATIAM